MHVCYPFLLSQPKCTDLKVNYQNFIYFQHKSPDYSLAYVIVKTDSEIEGRGMTFTVGRGTHIGIEHDILFIMYGHFSVLENIANFIKTLRAFQIS